MTRRCILGCRIITAGFALFLLIAHHESWAANWIAGESRWDNEQNWDTMQVPSYADEVRIESGTAVIIDGNVSSRITFVGGAFGGVRVMDSGKWTSMQGIFAGTGGGDGRVVIKAGGQAVSDSIDLGGTLNSSGELEVTGASALFSTGGITMGGSGNGMMKIEDGGKVLSNEIVILGLETIGTGTATITDSGSLWEHPDRMLVGRDGHGTVAVTSGGAITSGFVGIGGADAGFGFRFGSGSVTVSGSNSSWISSGAVRVGGGDASTASGNGIGTLTIKAGGEFSSAIEAILAVETGSNGSIMVQGTGSRWRVGGNATRIGNRGKGSLLVSAGGMVISTGVQTLIGHDATGQGTVTVSGPGSLWSNTGPVFVGILGGAELTVEDGGKISTPSITVTGQNLVTNVINLNGGDTPQSRGVIETTLVTSSHGNGQIRFNGGILRASANESNFIRPAPNPSLTVEIIARGAFIDTNGFAVGIGRAFSGIIGGLTKQGDGTLSLSAASTYQGATTIEQGTLQLANLPFAPGEDRLPIATALVVGNAADAGAAVFNLNGFNQTVGSLSSIGTTMSRVVTNSSGAASTLIVNQSIDTTFTGQLTGNLSLTKQGPGVLTLVGDNTLYGLTTVGGGTLEIDGSIGGVAVQNSSVFSPGQSPGKTTVNASYTQSAGSTLLMELGGTTRGIDYDWLAVAGTATFDGKLQVILVNNFNPQASQSFDILDWATMAGSFDTLELPTLENGLSWNTSQLLATGVISVGGQ